MISLLSLGLQSHLLHLSLLFQCVSLLQELLLELDSLKLFFKESLHLDVMNLYVFFKPLIKSQHRSRLR